MAMSSSLAVLAPRPSRASCAAARSLGALVLLGLLAACGGPACPPAPPPVAQLPSPPPRRPAPAPEPPPGALEARVLGVRASVEGYLLLLAEPTTGRVLPVVIGGAEAQVIDMRLRGERFPRPLTHDLMDQMIEALGGEVVFVHVDKLRGGVFVGSVHVWDGHEMHRIDARTSDAIAIAVGHEVPIYVSPVVLEEAGESVPAELLEPSE